MFLFGCVFNYYDFPELCWLQSSLFKKKNTAALVFCFLLVGGFMMRSPRYYRATPSLGLIKVVSKAISCCYYAFFYLYPSVNWLGGVFALQLFWVWNQTDDSSSFFFPSFSYC